MESNRPIVELLVIMKQNQDSFVAPPFGDIGGLCTWSNKLSSKGVISRSEDIALREYIVENRPKWYHQFPYAILRGKRTSLYYFKPGLLRPRLMWIDYHIKKLSKPPSDYYGPF